MEDNQYIGFEIHTIDRMIGRSSDMVARSLADPNMPAPGGWILGFLHRHGTEPVYQKDIEHKFCMPPSTVTKILKQMEKDGYISRVSVEDDARLKKIEITDKGAKLHEDIIETIHTQVDRRLLDGLSDQEIQELFRMLGVVHANADEIVGKRQEVGMRQRRRDRKDGKDTGKAD